MQIAFSPMLPAKELLAKQATQPNQSHSELFYSFFQTHEQDHPFIVQLCGNDPDEILAAALICASFCDAIDINLGCPQRCAQLGHFGAFLLDEPDRIVNIVSKLTKSSLSVPVTCKIRILDSPEKTIDLAKKIQDAGCSLLTVHGRTRSQRHHCGPVDYELIKQVKRNLDIPVFANGGIQNYQHALQILEFTGCDGIMAASELLRNPALFNQFPSITIPECASKYLEIVRQHPPLNSSIVRDHLITLLRPWLKLPENIDLFGLVNNRKLQNSDQYEAFLALFADRVSRNSGDDCFSRWIEIREAYKLHRGLAELPTRSDIVKNKGLC